MATAETARLIASLELQDKNFTRGIRNVERGVGRVDKKLSAFGGFVNRNLARGIDRVAASLVDGVFAGVESLQELEKAQAQTAAVLKSTGQAAGINGEQVTALAEKYEGLNAIVGDEFIRAGENMLLTFTNIKGEAFEPALAAALDLNTAMGKGPEGLTSTVIQVGKALNDPTKGLTALRKVGVSFTKEQQKKIKSLQKEGKLYEAQQIILKELNKEFGGSFAAQGDTTAGKVAKFHDAVEDLQRTFAKALLPIIVKVADKLGKFLGDPKVVAAIEQAGVTLARVFDEMLSTAEKLPWKQIGQGLGVAKDAAKGLLDAFLSMPAWVQTLLIGGVVATKLPVIGGLVSELGKGLIKGVLGINAGVVNLKAATVVGGGGPVPAGGGGAGGGSKGVGKIASVLGRLGTAAFTLGTVFIAGASLVALAQTFQGFITGVGESQGDLQEKVNATNKQNYTETIANLKATNANLERMNGFEEIIASGFGGGQITDNFEMAATRIVDAQGLTKDQTVAALAELKRSQKQAKELLLKTPKLDAAILTLERRLKTGARDRTPAKPLDKVDPRNKVGLGPLVKAGSEQRAELGNIKNAMATLNTKSAAQNAELGNIKNATATLDTTTGTGLTTVGTGINQAAIAAAGHASTQVTAQGRTTGAVNINASATRGVAPPITAAVYAIGASLAATIWAARPVIQSTNVVNNYSTKQRTGATSGSRNGGYVSIPGGVH